MKKKPIGCSDRNVLVGDSYNRFRNNRSPRRVLHEDPRSSSLTRRGSRSNHQQGLKGPVGEAGVDSTSIVGWGRISSLGTIISRGKSRSTKWPPKRAKDLLHKHVQTSTSRYFEKIRRRLSIYRATQSISSSPSEWRRTQKRALWSCILAFTTREKCTGEKASIGETLKTSSYACCKNNCVNETKAWPLWCPRTLAKSLRIGHLH